MAAEAKSEKFQVMFEPSTLKLIDDWGFANRIRTRAEAIRQLIHKGLEDSDKNAKGEASA